MLLRSSWKIWRLGWTRRNELFLLRFGQEFLEEDLGVAPQPLLEINHCGSVILVDQVQIDSVSIVPRASAFCSCLFEQRGGGKTTDYKTLAMALTQLRESGHPDEKYQKVIYKTFNPKAASGAESLCLKQREGWRCWA